MITVMGEGVCIFKFIVPSILNKEGRMTAGFPFFALQSEYSYCLHHRNVAVVTPQSSSGKPVRTCEVLAIKRNC